MRGLGRASRLQQRYGTAHCAARCARESLCRADVHSAPMHMYPMEVQSPRTRAWGQSKSMGPEHGARARSGDHSAADATAPLSKERFDGCNARVRPRRSQDCGARPFNPTRKAQALR
jgi:hypothetical protein